LFDPAKRTPPLAAIAQIETPVSPLLSGVQFAPLSVERIIPLPVTAKRFVPIVAMVVTLAPPYGPFVLTHWAIELFANRKLNNITKEIVVVFFFIVV
jgi:hypothetical protein